MGKKVNWNVSSILEYRDCPLDTIDGPYEETGYVLKLYTDGWAVSSGPTEVVSKLDIWNMLRWLNEHQAEPRDREEYYVSIFKHFGQKPRPIKSYDYSAVVWDGDVYCIECLPEGVNVEDDDVYPIFAGSEWDYPPVCRKCGEVHDYVSLLGND